METATPTAEVLLNRAKTWQELVPTAVVSGEGAAVLLGLPLPGPPPAQLELLAAPMAGAAPGARLRSTPVPANDVYVIQGLRVTSPARTLRDVAPVLSLVELVCCVDALRREHRWAPEERSRGFPGASALRRAVALSDPGSQSAFESLVRVVMLLMRFGPVRAQAQLPDDPHCFDLLLAWARRVFECDGRLFHSDPVAWSRDRRQGNVVARQRGFGLTRLTYGDAWPSPLPAAAEIRRAVLAGSGSRVRDLRRSGPEVPRPVQDRLVRAWTRPGVG